MAIVRTKICGITRAQDAEVAVTAGADAIGLNFYAKSKRFIEADPAAQIASNMAGRVAVFGVFVNSSVKRIADIYSKVRLTHIQFHGDESPEIVAETRAALSTAKTVRAVRVSNDDFEGAQQEIDAWQTAGVDLLLLDAASLDAFGGTGKTLDWDQLNQLAFAVPWLLAGGLNPSNVAQAIELCRPDGVDTASGVESQPGIKDTDLVNGFVENSKSGFAKP